MIIGLSGFAGSGKDAVADMLNQNQRFVKVALADPLKRIARDVYDFTDEQLWGPSSLRNKPDKRYPREHTWGGERKDTCQCCGIARLRDETGTGWFNTEYPQCYLTPRYALQLLGTEWGRHCYPHTWVDKAVRVAEQLLKKDYLAAEKVWEYDQKRGLVQEMVFDHVLPRSSAPHALGVEQLPKGVVVPDVRFKGEVFRLKEQKTVLVRIKRAGYDKPAFDHPSETEQVDIPDSEFDYILHNNRDLEQLRLNVAKMAMEVTGPEVVEMELQGRSPQLDQLLEDRQRDVDAGKIRDFDESQADVPPFKRR